MAGGRLDPYSTGMHFGGWIEPEFIPFPDDAQFLTGWYPRTWLLKIGWQRHGLLSPYDVAGESPSQA